MQTEFEIVLDVECDTFWTSWDELIKNTQYQHPMYNKYGIFYYKRYFNKHEFQKDVSIVLKMSGTPVAGIIASISKVDEEIILSGFGREINYSENVKASQSVLKKARNYLQNYLDEIISKNLINKVIYRDYFLIDGSISSFAKILLDKGAFATTWYLQIINLTFEITKIKSGMKKSCRHSVNSAAKKYLTKIVDSEEKDALGRLSTLHFRASGRQTRDISTWNSLEDMLINGKAFLAEAWHHEKCIASALFTYNSTTCLYSVSAADRDFFHTPVNHALIWEAIKYAKSLGCKNFEFGGLYYSTRAQKMTEKQKNINRFKKNFGGITKHQLELTLVL
ncbi:peptidoglycan bridge formation glycyltransferase FemA/FemB family protein [Amylibacter sp.]|nr:peptidoglycan bridge formation glycyltransferase FemA/FemB family protein [Amylibacter sp.]